MICVQGYVQDCGVRFVKAQQRNDDQVERLKLDHGDDRSEVSKVDGMVNRAWREARRGATATSEKLAMSIARDIVRQIGDGRLSAGSSLASEAEMATLYSVGRTTVREALRVLEMQGLVTIKTGPGGGPIVTDPTTADAGRMISLHMAVRGCTFGELALVRLQIDPILAAEAARIAMPNGIERLRDIVEIMEEIPLGRNSEWARTASMFNAIVAAMAGNSVFALLSSSLRAIYAERIGQINYTSKIRQNAIAYYRNIISAIEEKDAEKAQKNSHDLISESFRQMKKAHPEILSALVDWK
jgi:GntR family transcriptional regulator, transcriptional repressor for pyruvate dehydrogenase complex